MRKTLHWLSRVLAIAIATGVVATAAPSAFAQQGHHRVVIIQQVPVIDPFFAYPYPYAYPPNYVASNYGYVKVDTHRQNAELYIDGGYADRLEKSKKFALRPGNHDLELRDTDGRKLFQERVAVIVGKTTKVDVPRLG